MFFHQLVPADGILFLMWRRRSSVAPAHSEPDRSNIDMSWCGGVTEMKTSSAVTLQRCWVWCTTLAVARLLSTTH